LLVWLAELRPRHKTVQTIALQQETAYYNRAHYKETRRATPTARRASSQRLIEFINIIATCMKYDKCGMMMMLLHGDRNDGAVISGIYTSTG
jgi:hypothetical protein